MKNKLLQTSCSLFLIILSFACYAQKQNNNWLFGDSAWIKFNNTPPASALTSSSTIIFFGSSSISDKNTGQLLIYTDGGTVWDKNHNALPNGSGLTVATNGFGQQGSLIVQQPEHDSLYYVFTGSGYYSVVNMNLNGGLGNIPAGSKNISYAASNMEGITAVRHSNGKDIWIITEGHASLLTNAGFPVITVTNTIAGLYLKASPNGQKVAAIPGGSQTASVKVYDFNAGTGVVSGYVTLNALTNQSAAAFSSCSSLLYVSISLDPGAGAGLIHQYNLSLTDEGQVNNSKTKLPTSAQTVCGGLQLAPDGKIYCINGSLSNQSDWLGVIECPNVSGIGCNYKQEGFYLGGKLWGGALPNFLDDILAEACVLNAEFSNTGTCVGIAINFTDTSSVLPNISSWSWNFGDPASGIANTATSQNPSHTYASPGTYTMTFIVSDNCSSDTIRKMVYVIPQGNFSNDSTLSICAGETLQLTANGGDSYLWSSGQTTSAIAITPLANISYSVNISTVCGNGALTYSIIVGSVPVADAGIDATISIGASVTLAGSGGGAYSWLPSTGLSCIYCSNPEANPGQTTTYILTVTNAEGCTDTDTVIVTVDNNCGDIFVPNSFSPNGDVQNDVLYVFGNCITEMNFTITNRWGEVVFETMDQKIGWNGVYHDKQMDTAIFIYELKATLLNGEQVSKKGNVSLIR